MVLHHPSPDSNRARPKLRPRHLFSTPFPLRSSNPAGDVPGFRVRASHGAAARASRYDATPSTPRRVHGGCRRRPGDAGGGGGGGNRPSAAKALRRIGCGLTPVLFRGPPPSKCEGDACCYSRDQAPEGTQQLPRPIMISTLLFRLVSGLLAPGAGETPGSQPRQPA
jgi:hypothetical protein